MIQPEDLIDRAIDRIRHIEPNIPAERLEVLEDVLRVEFGGKRARVARRGNAERDALHAEIRRIWQDRKATTRAIARALGIHHSTVARALSDLRNRQP